MNLNMPHNLEAEEAVIGSILIDPSVVNDVMEILRSDDFSSQKHRAIFTAMERLYERGEPIDVLTVCEELKKTGRMKLVGSEIDVARIAEAVPTSANVLYYAQIVRDKAILRSLIEAGRRIEEMAREEREVDEILDQAERIVFDIAESRATRTYEHIGAIMHQVFENLEELRTRASTVEPGAVVSGLPTGLKSLDRQTTGFHKSDLVVVAARPSVGKTAFALTIAKNMAVKFNIPVGIFSLEMSKEQLAQRLLCSEAHVDLHKLRTGYLTNEEWNRLTIAASNLYKANIIVDDEPSLDPRTLRAKARRMKREYNVEAIFVDYLQLMHIRGKNAESRQQEISEISRSLKLLARELDIVVVALSQLSRAVETREDKRPRLSDLRESGAIEQDADTVIFIYREEYYKKTEKIHEPHEAEIIIGKQRNGPIGTVILMFEPQTASFYEIEHGVE
ncbi:replicative DNA helicase [Pseudothermotoga thermarum]|uniref:Replicative DNA helicase n=1 Tax=Pseudothermotoga thermarum DSM 5069 TaxID=688269 RepID=F7YWV1_9THEM|nr:replicative DNA helicase [Pseudothermotoga thermarum]AEH50471.1 primary replicative DNA helicase [Pseudothermotoga thermarum DSM 5069]